MKLNLVAEFGVVRPKRVFDMLEVVVPSESAEPEHPGDAVNVMQFLRHPGVARGWKGHRNSKTDWQTRSSAGAPSVRSSSSRAPHRVPSIASASSASASIELFKLSWLRQHVGRTAY